MWSDNETTKDLLSFRIHADLIRSIITDPNQLPITIGVFGDWGSGKTSIMKMLQEDLDPDTYEEGSDEKREYGRIACLYFNGWLFEGYDDAKAAVLSSILMQLAVHKRFGPKIKDKVVPLMKSVNWMRAVRLGAENVALPAIAAYLTGGASLIPSLVSAAKGWVTPDGSDQGQDPSGIEDEAKEGDTEESEDSGDKDKIDWEKLIKADKTPSGPTDVRSFRDRFQEMLKNSDIDSLIVLIDDLDRCSPERIIDNLEAIKLFLNVDRTAFVIGADPRIVKHAIQTKYKPIEFKNEFNEEDEAENLITDYLEKLIQVPYHLPRLSPAEVETYMALLFCIRDLGEEENNKCHIAYLEHRTQDRYSIFGYGNIKEALGGAELPTELSQSLIFCASAAPLITEGLKGNPRQIKRFLNAFVLRKKLADVAKLENIKDDILVKLMVLEYGHVKEFRQLYDWQASQDGFPTQIKSLENALRPTDGNDVNESAAEQVSPDWVTNSMKRWVMMDPPLSEVDLRDYFWVARDRLQKTLTDVSLIPPAVRRVLDDLLSDNPGRRNIGAKTSSDFNADERSTLITYLELQIVRSPDQIIGYEAIRTLMENDIHGSGEALVNALKKVPADSIEPTVAPMLLMMEKSHPELKTAIDRLKKTSSKVGSALKRRQKTKV